jgi:Cu(I)/Ag(I) efflux system membrane protein CusA/SilA
MNLHVNIMSLAGIAISIGVLVDASVVIVENVTFSLNREWGDRPVTGNTDLLVARATALVARPAVLAVAIMLVSFLPIFALSGIDGQLIRPLAWTKTLTLLSVIVLTVTLVPALCSVFIRGRLRREDESWIVRGVIRVYRPVLTAVCQGSWVFGLLLSGLIIFAAATTGSDLVLRIAVVAAILSVWLVVVHWFARLGLAILLIVLALSAQSWVRPIGMALRLPLDEGMIMDMPITLPRMTVLQAADDLKARNMLMCRFPEIHMVTGKAGRAETAFDPAPIDMIESMVEFRPTSKWPKRRMLKADARQHAAHIVKQMIASKLIEASDNESQLLDAIVDSGLKRFDAIQRETCWHLLQTFERELSKVMAERVASYLSEQRHRNGKIATHLSEVEVRASVEKLDNQDRQQLARQLDANSLHVVVRELSRIIQTNTGNKLELNRSDPPKVASAEQRLLRNLQSMANASWKRFVRSENQVLYRRAGITWTQIVVDELCARQAIIDVDFQQTRQQVIAARFAVARSDTDHHTGQHLGLASYSALPLIDPNAVYEAIVRDAVKRFDRSVWLWAHDQSSLIGPGGELDETVQMPGWANVWTRPIQNRIDMLATGVSSEVGVRVLGEDFESVVATSERIAKALQQIPGASDVIADPIRGKGYVKFDIQNELVSQFHLDRAEVDVALQAATTGYLLEPMLSNSDHFQVPIRLTIQPPLNSKSDSVLDTSLALRSNVIPEHSKDDDAPVELVGLGKVAKVRHFDGPATIKSAGGQLCNYVRLNVRGRDATNWVNEAKEVLKMASLPSGISIEWTGQYEHAARTRDNLLWMVPLCVLLIVLLLLFAFHDFADAMLMLMSIPGALAGGALAQWFLGYPFSVSVGVGYLACFGMAAATSMVMIIYLRQALSDAGGLHRVATLDELRDCIIRGAVHRIRPKLLTEATMVLSLAPLLWSTGVGADVIRPMAAPVLGGILIADEIVDLLIPAMFFAVRRRRWLRSRTLTS